MTCAAWAWDVKYLFSEVVVLLLQDLDIMHSAGSLLAATHLTWEKPPELYFPCTKLTGGSGLF